MIKKRIIPILQFKNNLAIKTKQFDKQRNLGNLLQYVKVFSKRQSDEMSIINLSKNEIDNTVYDFDFLKGIVSECNMPLSVGGGIRDLNIIERLLELGCDKIVIGNNFIKNKNFIKKIVKSFGSQLIIASIDVIKKEDKFKVFLNNELELNDWIKEVQDFGAGEILLTAVHNEGMMNGYDIELLDFVYNSIYVPILLNGGASKISDFEAALSIDKVYGACASSIFLFSEITPNLIKKNISKKINLRIT